MTRPKKHRCIHKNINADYFKPWKVRVTGLEEINLGFDEIEAIRLKDLEMMDQEKASELMNVSQPTFHRILKESRQKIADAIVNGKALKIEGGRYNFHEKGKCKCGHHDEE